MPNINLPGTQAATSTTRYCNSHEQMRPVAGGCDLGLNHWVCADCWQRRRLSRGAARLAADLAKEKAHPAGHPNPPATHAPAVLEQTRTQWGLDQP